MERERWKTFSCDKGKFLGVFSTTAPNGMDANSSGEAQAAGLALDVRGRLLVGVVNEKYISQHTTDKTYAHIRSFPVPIEPYCLAATSENTLIVSSYKSHKVQLVNDTGRVIHTFAPPDSIMKARGWSPYGVCCDKYVLFVCNWATDENRGIHFFSLAGQYHGCIIPSTYCPKGVALGGFDDKLLVTEAAGIGPRQGVKAYRRKWILHRKENYEIPIEKRLVSWIVICGWRCIRPTLIRNR